MGKAVFLKEGTRKLINNDRLIVANQVINLLMPGVKLIKKTGWIWVEWRGAGKTYCKQWQTLSGSFYPVWSNKFPEGGTRTTAMAQLINWVREKPCLPIQTWRYWCGPIVGLKPIEVVDILLNSGYPSEFKCVFCGKKDVQMDWYTYRSKQGLGCYKPCEPIRQYMDSEATIGKLVD